MLSTQFTRRSAFKQLSQLPLANFAETVFQQMSALPEYKPFAATVERLGQQLNAYRDALGQAAVGGTDRVTNKNVLKDKVIQTLEDIALQLDQTYKGDKTWIIYAGMEFIERSVQSRGPLPAPSNLLALPQEESGSIALRFKMPERKRVRMYAIEHSADEGQSWQNGTYVTSMNVVVSGLPAKQQMLFRVRAMGSAARKSPWSKPLSVFVL